MLNTTSPQFFLIALHGNGYTIIDKGHLQTWVLLYDLFKMKVNECEVKLYPLPPHNIMAHMYLHCLFLTSQTVICSYRLIFSLVGELNYALSYPNVFDLTANVIHWPNLAALVAQCAHYTQNVMNLKNLEPFFWFSLSDWRNSICCPNAEAIFCNETYPCFMYVGMVPCAGNSHDFLPFKTGKWPSMRFRLHTTFICTIKI